MVFVDDGRCAMTIRTIGGQDFSKWDLFWDEAVALVGMCARRGLKGVASRLGELFTTRDVDCFRLTSRVGLQAKLSIEITTPPNTNLAVF